MKLAAKLILIFLCGVLGIVLLFSWQTIHQQDVWDQKLKETHAFKIVDVLKPSILKSYKDEKTLSIEHAVEITSQMLNHSQIRWVDEKTAITIKKQKQNRKFLDLIIPHWSKHQTRYSYVPLSIDDENQGVIEVAQSMVESNQLIRDSVFNSILSIVGVTVLSVFVIYLGGIRFVGSPLQELVEQVNLIGEGHLSQPQIVNSKDELGSLSKAISQMSHKLSNQQDVIRHSDRLGTVGVLASGVAHELGTPLNVVSGRAGLIAGGKLSLEEVVDSAKTIKSESDRMTLIIRQLLDFARQTPSTHSKMDLNSIASRTCDVMLNLARSKNVELEYQSKEPSLEILGDSNQIQQVISNLISNAIAALPNGGKVIVGIEKEADSGDACIRVVDNGVGIKPNDINHIFEPFFTTKDVGEGTGLGLSIAYGIVKDHGGEITVAAEQGKRTEFKIRFPLLSNEDAKGIAK